MARSNLSLTRRQALRGAAGLGLLLATSPAAALAAPADPVLPSGFDATLAQESASAEPDLSWVTLKPESLANWHFKLDAADGTRFTLTPKYVDPATTKLKTVMIPFAKASPPFDATMSKILDVMYQKQVPVSFSFWFFQRKTENLRRAVEFAEANNFDLLAPMGSESTEFLHEIYLNGKLPALSLFTKDPVLIGWMKDFVNGSGTNMAYCSTAVSIPVQMSYLQAVRAEVKHIGVLYASSSTSTMEAQVIPLRAVAAANGINMTEVVVTDDMNPHPEFTAKVPPAVAAMERNDPGFQKSVFYATGTTAVINSIELIAQLAGKVPVVSAWPDLVKEGPGSAVLSIGITYDNVGYLASKYLLDILFDGTKPANMPVGVVAPPDLAISFLKARQVGLKIPYSFFETAGYIYDHRGRAVRLAGHAVTA